ncbi:hypothetical protein ICL16_41635 [Iningainema sp. BLCCT55]|uniref:Uncharacterized protein n=2 Tax=Iningainema TaxID=1932705 RepID=A0A8J6XRQ6_9CYAN|nr:hypothetical protein [Iningainema tapete BLCC-T55]
MIQSLRRWGGKFASAPIFAVTPRFGPPLTHKTRQLLEDLQVQYLRFQKKSNYPWNTYLNKLYALQAVEQRVKSECVAWLDSDLLVLNEPDQLTLNQEESFAACAPDKNIGTTGVDDPHEPYWREICKYIGLDIEDLPWIKTEQEGIRIRLYWNSGLFVYRRSTNFAEHYLQTFFQMCDSRIASHESGCFFNDQVALGLTMVKMGIPWRALPYSHNYSMGSRTHKHWYSEEKLTKAKIIHYHDAMLPDFWETFLECLSKTHPPVADWLSPLGPLRKESPLQWRAMNKLLHTFRLQQKQAYLKSCKVV